MLIKFTDVRMDLRSEGSYLGKYEIYKTLMAKVCAEVVSHCGAIIVGSRPRSVRDDQIRASVGCFSLNWANETRLRDLKETMEFSSSLLSRQWSRHLRTYIQKDLSAIPSPEHLWFSRTC